MRMICHNCKQVVDAPENRADGAVRCPQCRALTYLPGCSTRSRLGPGSASSTRVGLGWPGYVVVAVVVALTAFAFVRFRGHVQHRVLGWALPAGPADAVRLGSFYCTNALPAGTNRQAIALSERKEKAGYAYLVLEVSVEASSAGVRRLTEAELEEVKRRNPGFAMAEVWVSLPVNRWFKIVGPGHPLRPACAHLESPGVFAASPAWNSPPAPDRPDRVAFTVCFEVERKMAEAGGLSFQYRWRRPLPLVKREGASGEVTTPNPAQ